MLKSGVGAHEVDALVARLADGDRAAFSPLFERLWPALHRFCASVLANDADASDAAQETMKKVLERAAEYDRTRPAMPWALAIAAWECRTIRRRRTRRREVPEQQTPERRDESGADRELERRDLERAIAEALGALSQTDRDALIATFWEEAPMVFGATLRQRRRRALQRLRMTWRRLYGLD